MSDQTQRDRQFNKDAKKRKENQLADKEAVNFFKREQGLKVIFNLLSRFKV